MAGVHYPVGVVAHCYFPAVLLRRPRAPAAATTPSLLHRPSTPPPSPSPWRRRLAVQGHNDDGFFTVDYDPGDVDKDEEDGSPWEGALVYRRDAAVHHVEYATTLERLGLAGLSSPHSRARAAAMGILISSSSSSSSSRKEREAEQTPVLVSVDVARRRGRLRLDGVLRTVITLGCYRCAEPAPEGIFANFSLLLTEEPVEEPDVVDLGTIYEEDRAKASSLTSSQDEDDEDVDWDDRLHFPAGQKEIDVSKHIRDIIHLEITLDAFCSPTCKGLCLVCGANLNTSSCSCNRENPKASGVKRHGTLKDLLKPMQR